MLGVLGVSGVLGVLGVLLLPVPALPTSTMFEPGSVVIYTRSSGNLVLATVVGPSPRGEGFIHLRYQRTLTSGIVDNAEVQLSACQATFNPPPLGVYSNLILPAPPTPSSS